MKKKLSVALAIILSLSLIFALAACSTGGQQTTSAPDASTDAATDAASGEELKIGIIQYASHPSLDNCYEGIRQGLEDSGLNYTLDRQIGSDASTDADCAAYAQAMVAQNYDMIFAIATPAAISTYAATEGTDIPVIFCAVSDPVSAKLVESNENPGGLCTGTSDVLDFDAQLEIITSMQPDVETIGILYTTSEPNSISQLESFKALCQEKNIAVEATGIQNDSDIPAAAAALCEKVDCINNFTDNKVVNNLSVVLSAANDAGIPVYGSEVEQVKNGCLAAASIDYVALGKVTAQMGVDVLGGADISTMAVKTIAEASPVINSKVLGELSIAMPEQFSEAETVVTNE